MKNVCSLFNPPYGLSYLVPSFLLLMAIAGCYDPAGGNSEPEVPQTQKGGWKLVWHDEFSGSRIDTQKSVPLMLSTVDGSRLDRPPVGGRAVTSDSKPYDQPHPTGSFHKC